jgi:hypothetical protein
MHAVKRAVVWGRMYQGGDSPSHGEWERSIRFGSTGVTGFDGLHDNRIERAVYGHTRRKRCGKAITATTDFALAA